MKPKNKRYTLSIIGVALLLYMASCSVFRRGCKCPTVHHNVVVTPR